MKKASSGLNKDTNYHLGITQVREHVVICEELYARVENTVTLKDQRKFSKSVWYEHEITTIYDTDGESFNSLEFMYQLILLERQLEQERIEAHERDALESLKGRLDSPDISH